MEGHRLHRRSRWRCIHAVSFSSCPAANGSPANQSAKSNFYRLLREHRALEKVQEMLSPFHLPEELTIKAAECGVVNSWYKRENFKPTVTICYEYLRHILESLPNATSPAGVTPDDATAGQFYWLTLHE